MRLADDDLDDIPGAVRRSIQESLARLKRSSVDLLQLHNSVGRERDLRIGRLSVGDVLGPGGAADALDAAREAGLTRLTGFTALGDVDVLHEIVTSGRFSTAQVYHNVLNPSATGPVPAAFSAVDYRGLATAAVGRGVGVLNIRVLAAGVLGGRQPRWGAISRGSEPERDVERAAGVARAMEAEAGTLPQKAIRFALDRSGISGVLVGFSNPEQVDEAVAAAAMSGLSDKTLAKVGTLYESDFSY